MLTDKSINLNSILRYASTTNIERGKIYYYQGRVVVTHVNGHNADCLVRGAQNNQVVFIEENDQLSFSCSCSFSKDGAICKHEVAAAYALLEYLHTHSRELWQMNFGLVLEMPKRRKPKQIAAQWMLFSLEHSQNGWTLTPYMLAYREIQESLLSLWTTGRVANKEALAQWFHTYPEELGNAKPYRSQYQSKPFLNASPEVIHLANILASVSTPASNYWYRSDNLSGKFIADSLSILLNTDAMVFLSKGSSPLDSLLFILDAPGKLSMLIEHREDGMHVEAKIKVGDEKISIQNSINFVSSSPPWVLAEDHFLFKLSEEHTQEFLDTFLENPNWVIPPEDESEFLDKYVPALSEVISLEGDEIKWEDIEGELVKRLYLSEVNGQVHVQLRFAYGGFEVGYDLELPEVSVVHKADELKFLRVYRYPKYEEETYRALSSTEFGLKRSEIPDVFLLRSKLHPLDFLMKKIPRLAQSGYEIYGEDAIKSVRVNRSMPTLKFNITSGIDWFDVKTVVNFGDIEVSLKEIRKAFRKKEQYIKLIDGSIGEIPIDWIDRYRNLFSFSEDTEGGLRFSSRHITMLDQLLEKVDDVQVDEEFQRRKQRLSNFSNIAIQELPQDFTGELRPYQKSGFDWLHFLHDYEFGGCLADDMGLGKTVQVLVFLQSLQERNSSHKTNLLVLPRSLLVNWQREASRFTPSLRVMEYFGLDRAKRMLEFDQYDLILTTYRIMYGDIEKLRNYPFYYAILDESQAIKNPLSETSKAARLLNAKHRLVLTGTPIENSTVELWSQFAFLNPGLLGSLDYFKGEFSNAIEKDQSQESAQFLRKTIFPFILRRTKEQVAPELPPRTERILYCDMEPNQRKVYNRTRDFYRGLILGMLEKDGFQNSRMKILEGLLRLRQICNHPRLVDANFHGESAKFELLLDTLKVIKEGNHKALVFSQFVEMLKLIKSAMDTDALPYVYLDGRTQDRQERVDTFQNDPTQSFFLISLKAGGFGLNLTAADYVIHVDPWWNPAVEVQASDRAHRIGQDKPVFIYKLIVRDSIEEKVLLLQERKRNLVDQLITTETSFFKSLNRQDVEDLFGS